MVSPVPDKDELLLRLADNQQRIKECGVQQLGLFGSFTHRRQTPQSDVDLLVHFKPGMKSFDNFMDLSLLLEEILQRRVELVTAEALSPHLGPHILAEVENVSLDN